MTWRHPSPAMTSDGPAVATPPCRARVYRVTGNWYWTYFCPAHPEPKLRASWSMVLRAARYHCGLRT